MFCGRSSRAFTLIELMVAIAIGGILMTLAYAPYSFYTDKSRVNLSVEKIEQAFSKAKLLSTTGYTFPRTSQNADLAVYVRNGAKSVEIRALKAGTSEMAVGGNTALVEDVRMEDKVVVSSIDAASAVSEFMVIYRAPAGKMEIK
jgi:prepilin-type N-terminal cleavage/methylation domain-containing protein